MRVIVVVPYRPDGGHRDRLWDFMSAYWQQFKDFELVVGRHDDGPFNRSAAINQAVRSRHLWDVAVIADSDTWVDAEALRAAVSTAHETGRLCSALTAVIELDERCTEAILEAGLSERTLGVDAVRTGDLATQSSVLAVPRKLWENIGGFDENFVGWGGEDNAFWRAATILGGEPRRIDGFAFHLWHPPAATAEYKASDPGYRANLARWNRYRVARNERQLRQVQNAP